MEKIPSRPFGSDIGCSDKLPSSISMVGLGCSSFSTFFWSDQELRDIDPSSFTSNSLDKEHSVVKKWIETIIYAVTEAGITLLDTAPWYGHGTSEVVIGWAFEELSRNNKLQRCQLTLNTKVGRYEADPAHQFDFSREMTLKSIEISLQRMKTQYIDVLQLHDPEFAPTLDILMEETLPAMLECQKNGLCKALGMTGYPLLVQHQILQRSMEVFGRNIWDQSLTYGHFNLHDTSLISRPIIPDSCFYEYCQRNHIAVLAAAPLSMGLLTHNAFPGWHPASAELQTACQEAAKICKENDIDISSLALLFALSHPGIPSTILGMKDKQQVQTAQFICSRFKNISLASASHESILESVLNEDEWKVLQQLRDSEKGPFKLVWEKNLFDWDGVKEVHNFWKQLENVKTLQWQQKTS